MLTQHYINVKLCILPGGKKIFFYWHSEHNPSTSSSSQKGFQHLSQSCTCMSIDFSIATPAVASRGCTIHKQRKEGYELSLFQEERITNHAFLTKIL